MGTKVCTKCGVEKPLAEYHKAKDCKFGVRAHCKICLLADAAARYNENRDRLVADMRERRKADPEAVRQYHRAYYKANTEKRRAYFRKWRENNRDRYLEGALAAHHRRYLDPKMRLESSIRAGVQKCLRGERKSARTFALLGYSRQELAEHLERQFAPGMTWENYGQWHVDHIVPLSSFNYAGPDDPAFRQAWCLTNLRPLWAADNLKKGAKRLSLL